MITTVLSILFIVVLFLYLAVALYLDSRLISYEYNVRWIKSELEILKALIKDHDQLGIKRDEVEKQVRLVWEIEDLFGIHHQLSEAENEWIKSSKLVVEESEGCVADYDKQHEELSWGTLAFRWSHIRVLLQEIYDSTGKLIEHLKEREEKAKDIYTSMEKARSKNRRLLDQHTMEVWGDKPVAEHADNTVAAQNQKPSTSFDELLRRSTDAFPSMEERWSTGLLLPLHAFVKELRQLRIETETEKLWRTEAEGIIKDAEVYIGHYLCWS